MGSENDDTRAPDTAASFDWDGPLQNSADDEDGNGDSLEPLTLSSLRDIDSAAWLARTNSPFETNSNSGKKLSPADRCIDSFPPVSKRKKRKQKQAEKETSDDDHPLFAASQGRRKKKPNGMPKRALSAYNCYFQEERARLMEKGQVQDGPNILPSGRIGFEELGKIIGSKWRSLPEAEKQRFHDLAAADNDRYHREMEAWRENHKDEYEPKQKAVKVRKPQASPAVSAIDLTKPPPDDAGHLKFPEEDKASEPMMSSFIASEASIRDNTDLQSQESFSCSAYSPFPSRSPSVSGSELNLMTSQVMPHRTTGNPSSSEAGMSPDHEAPQMRPWYDDRGFFRRNEPRAGGEHAQFASRASQQQYAPSIQHPYNTQGECVGFPSGSIGGAPGFTLAGVPRRAQDPPPSAFPVSPGMEIVMPDQNGVQQKYRIQYACYLVTREEAKEYVDKFGDCPLRVGPPPVLHSGARPMR